MVHHNLSNDNIARFSLGFNKTRITFMYFWCIVVADWG